MNNFDEIMKRLKNEVGIKNAYQLSKIIDVPQPTISRKKKKNLFEANWAYKLSKKFNLLTEWIMTGEGPKSLSLINKENRIKNNQLNDNIESTDKEKWVECYWHDKKIKTVPIKEGSIYIVDPINPQRKKYRGEKVKLIHYGKWGNCEILRLDSEWHVKRRHYIEINICDLKLQDTDKTRSYKRKNTS